MSTDTSADVDSMAGSGVSGSEPYAGTGRYLRDARIAAGKTIADVSTATRVREHHLEAMEEGRFTSLPGPAYISGFTRSYAEYLDLDPTEVLRRVELEVGSGVSDAHADYQFPQPAGESRAPGAATVIFAILLAGAVYGAWYFVSVFDQPAIQVDTEVPERLRVPAPPVPDASGVDAPATVPSFDQASGDTVQGRDRPTRVEFFETGRDITEPPAPATPGGPSIASALEAPAEGVLSGPLSEDLADEFAEDYITPRVKPVSELPPPPTENIELRAIHDTWIQVSSDEGAVLTAQLMRAGEVYQVPHAHGLTLMVADAGAIEVTVDGQALAPLGARGAMLRNLSLAAADLVSAQP